MPQDQLDSESVDDSAPATTTPAGLANRFMKRRNVLRKNSTSSKASGSRLRLNISPPSAFKHYFHLGSDVYADNSIGTSTASMKKEDRMDEDAWRQVIEMRMNVDGNTKMHTLQPDPPSPLLSAPAHQIPIIEKDTLQSLDATTFVPLSSPVPSSSSSTHVPATEMNRHSITPRAMKRTSLVKRKPVPPLYPEEPLPPRPSVSSQDSVVPGIVPKENLARPADATPDMYNNLDKSPRPSLSSAESSDSGSTAPPPTPTDSDGLMAELGDLNLLGKAHEQDAEHDSHVHELIH